MSESLSPAHRTAIREALTHEDLPTRVKARRQNDGESLYELVYDDDGEEHLYCRALGQEEADALVGLIHALPELRAEVERLTRERDEARQKLTMALESDEELGLPDVEYTPEQVTALRESFRHWLTERREIEQKAERCEQAEAAHATTRRLATIAVAEWLTGDVEAEERAMLALRDHLAATEPRQGETL